MDSGQDFSSTSRQGKYVRIQDQPRSQIDPIPYYPNLHRQLHSIAASIVLAYLEIHHPAPQDHPEAPVTIDADTISHDLQTGRRTLLVTLCILSVFWRDEGARARGARANREFSQPDHSLHGTTKPYSITGPKSWRPHTTRWILRRNIPFLRHILNQAHADSDFHYTDVTGGESHAQTALPSLGELIIGASMLGVDGRMTKAERMAGVLGKISK